MTRATRGRSASNPSPTTDLRWVSVGQERLTRPRGHVIMPAGDMDTMPEEFPEDLPPASPEETGEAEALAPDSSGMNLLSHWQERLIQFGLGEALLRVGTHVLSLFVTLIVIALMQSLYRSAPVTSEVQAAAPTPTPVVAVAAVPPPSDISLQGIPRLSQIHTTIPSRPRLEITTYTVQPGDTIFGIAEKFGLKPQTILWGNYYTLLDDPHNLMPGQELVILPVDGTYYEWQEGDGLNGVAKFFGVTPEDIINFPGNHLDPETIGDYSHPNIEPGTWLIIPGGKREFVSWSAPVGVTRENPAIARVLGPGACDPVYGGPVGYGSFVWPTNKHYLSGFDYSPETNHRGIDIAGYEGEGVYAADAGVVVYAGWNDYGYGNMIMIDHGNGFQTLYAHLSAIYVGCGQGVGRGDPIGAIGSTGRSSGPHLHFELMHTYYSKLNPWDFLPPP
ncbi:MAG: M23 family metallopeptidase [Anaerolineae bacterium]|nr:MAG: M23 family metallopeptidase [Anaerolineae bacterium]